MTVIASTGGHGLDGATSDEPSPRGGWMAGWTELVFWPWREIPVVMRSVASRLMSTAAGSAGTTQELAARVDAVHAATAALERRVAALEGQVREDAMPEDDAPDLARLSARSSDALREALTRAGKLAAQRGLKASTDSAIVFGDLGVKTHAETDAPEQRPRKAPRNRHRRA